MKLAQIRRHVEVRLPRLLDEKTLEKGEVDAGHRLDVYRWLKQVLSLGPLQQPSEETS